MRTFRQSVLRGRGACHAEARQNCSRVNVSAESFSSGAGGGVSETSVRGIAIDTGFSGAFLLSERREASFRRGPVAISLAGSGSSGIDPSRRIRLASGAGWRCRGANSKPSHGILDVLSMLADLRVTAQPLGRQQPKSSRKAREVPERCIAGNALDSVHEIGSTSCWRTSSYQETADALRGICTVHRTAGAGC